MFGREDQFAKVDNFGIRVKDERQADPNHLIEVTFEVPLDHELADEIMPAMAADLFSNQKGEWIPKAEIQQAKFNLAPGQQILTLKGHPETDPDLKVEGVTLRRITAKKSDSGSWLLMFTAGWVMGPIKEAVAIITRLKQGVYLTLVQQQQDMLDEGQAPDNGDTATVDGSGNVTKITEGKRRGRKKKDPEAEAKAQAEAGKAAAAEDGDGTAAAAD